MQASDIAAWWGAIVATAILFWDIIKWKKSGVTVKVKAVPVRRPRFTTSSGFESLMFAS
jgi:hypothetical protein